MNFSTRLPASARGQPAAGRVLGATQASDRNILFSGVFPRARWKEVPRAPPPPRDIQQSTHGVLILMRPAQSLIPIPQKGESPK